MNPLTIECSIHMNRRGRGGRKEVQVGPAPSVHTVPGRVPRVARLMALALRFDQLVQSGEVKDYATLARVGSVTRARMSQIMTLVFLAPDIIEQILFLPRVERGRDPIVLRDLLPIAMQLEWRRQRKMCEFLRGNRK